VVPGHRSSVPCGGAAVKASWPNPSLACTHCLHRAIMFASILETAARAAACWSAARPREAASTTAHVLISPPPRLAPMELAGIVAVASIAYAGTNSSPFPASRQHYSRDRSMAANSCTGTLVAGEQASVLESLLSFHHSNRVEGTARSQSQQYS
jgi:hypothetical protein